MSDFDKAIAVVLQHEGGWVSDPHDRGGETNFGISTLIIQRENLKPEDLGVDPATFGKPGWLKAMTVDTAKALYRRLFWERYGYDGIVEQLSATKVFDCAVNCGAPRAHAFAQRAATRIGHPAKVDGIIGAETIAAINACEAMPFAAAFADEMRQYYESIISANPSQSVFESNWLKRARWGISPQP